MILNSSVNALLIAYVFIETLCSGVVILCVCLVRVSFYLFFLFSFLLLVLFYCH